MRADVIKFELSPQGNSNSLKFDHEHLLNHFFIDQGVTGLIATGYCTFASQFMELSPALIISPSITSIQYKVERDKRYLPYIELGRWLCSDFQLNSRLIFTTDNLKPIRRRA